jgi:hypothetical protein
MANRSLRRTQMQAAMGEDALAFPVLALVLAIVGIVRHLSQS